MSGPIRIGVDAGGTFTDFHVADDREAFVHKVRSTPDDPARALADGLAEVLARLALARRVAGRAALKAIARRIELVHGTTVGTNALLTGRVARTAFVTTAGFEDLIEIGRQNRARLYDLAESRPSPLVPRELRFGLDERTTVAVAALGRAGGGSRRAGIGLRRAPRANHLARLAGRLRRARVQAVAIGFLHSYCDPANEKAAGKRLSALGIPVTLSSAIASEYREYERFATAIANACLSPGVGAYLAALERGCRVRRLWVLQSDASTASARGAAREPVRTVLSGPAGGALAAEGLASRLGDPRVLSFDMGGTSTDAVLIDGELPRTRLGAIAGIPLRTPMIDVRTVGAGGGSIARRDVGGALRVGPDSAGADPGPACYGTGSLPTVTDAHLVLGRLGERDVLGGAFPVDRARARAALERLGRAMQMSAEEAAEGVLEVVEGTMERALRSVSLQRGRDPRDFALYAFGGAGGMHACALARRLGIRRVVIPPSPGVFSARGLAAAPCGVELSLGVTAHGIDAAQLDREFTRLERRAQRKLTAQGAGLTRRRLTRLVDLRYRGQSHEITVGYGRDMGRRFEREHTLRHGHARPGSPIEVVTIRVRIEAPIPVRIETSIRRRIDVDALAARSGKRERITITYRGRRRAALSIARETILPDDRVVGPARITEYSATTFVEPGWIALRAQFGCLVLVPAKAGSVPARPRGGAKKSGRTKRPSR